jgi:hypothetical protein
MMRGNERPGNAGPRALRSGIAVAIAAAVAACSSDDGMQPPGVGFTLTVVDGEQVAATGVIAPDPIVVRLTDTTTGAPEEEATITWSVITGSGGRVLPATSTTDSLGLASTLLEVGAVAGDYTVRATASGADPVSVTVRAFASAPTLTSLTPSAVSPGQTVTIGGSGFSDRADDNAVFFGSNRAAVASASPSELIVTVPPCMATADADVTVRLGPLVSNALTASVTGDARTPLSLGLGESRVLSSPANLECTVLSGDAGEAYVVILGNAGTDPLDRVGFRLVGQPESAPATLVSPPAAARTTSAPGPQGSEQDRFELGLRALERSLTSAAPLARTSLPPGAAASRVWQIGQRDDFQVFNGNGFDFTTVSAEVVFTSARAVLFEDVNAPENGFTEADYEAFAAEFDDPIYDRDVDVFGQPSDIDGNGRIIILFTPVVNELTPPNSDGFVAGFFFGLDLTSQANSNEGEIFYSVVPDPAGEFGDPRTRDRILEVVPPVLAHELQHMIHFNQRRLLRSGGGEDLWLSEALAHTAESIVSDEFAARGDDVRAADFELSNLARARRYLLDPEETRLVARFGDGTLAERGAGWMFMQYLRGHFGGDAIVTSLSQTTSTGVANVTSKTGESWLDLITHWLIANYADDAPELPTGPTDPRDSYPNRNLRAEFQDLGLSYPLTPQASGFTMLVEAADVPSSAGRYLELDAGAGASDLRLRLTGEDGEPFPSGAIPTLSVIRTR